MTYENRRRIKELLDMGFSVPEIAKKIGVHHDTIYKELDRCGGASQYDPDMAQTDAEKKRKNQNNFPSDRQIFKDAELSQRVSDLILEEGLNIQQVIDWLQTEDAGRFRRLPKSRNTIFAAIDGGLIPGVTRETLKTRTVKLFSGDLVHIPQWVIRELGLHDGDELALAVTEESIILKK